MSPAQSMLDRQVCMCLGLNEEPVAWDIGVNLRMTEISLIPGRLLSAAMHPFSQGHEFRRVVFVGCPGVAMPAGKEQLEEAEEVGLASSINRQ